MAPHALNKKTRQMAGANIIEILKCIKQTLQKEVLYVRFLKPIDGIFLIFLVQIGKNYSLKKVLKKDALKTTILHFTKSICLFNCAKIGLSYKRIKFDLAHSNLLENSSISLPQEEKRPRDFMMSELQTLLDSAGVVSVQAWINAGNTKTTGLDFVLNWKKDALDLGLIGNFNETKIESIDTPTELSSTKIFAREEKGLITNSRPKSKLILTADYDMGRWTAGLYNTRFGEVTVTAPLEYDDIIGTDDLNFDGTPVLDDQGNASTRDIITGREAIVKGIDQVLSAKLITDFRLAYKFTPQLTLTGIMNNMFDIYPDVTLASTRTSQAGSRFLYSSEVQQQGQLGRNYTLALSYKF
jgi:outer membrane receptor protein involved in Fe transport